MSANVIEIVKGLVTPNLLNTVSSAIGVPSDVAGRGLTDLIGQYFGALVQQSGDRDVMASIADMANSVSRDTSGINDIKGLLAGGIPSTMAVLSGNRLMGSLFGVWQASVVHKAASALGINAGASSSLFNLAAPLVLQALSKRLGGGALTGAALAGLIGQERGALMSGMGSLASSAAASVKSAAPAAVAAAPVAAAAAAAKAPARAAAPAPAPAAYAGRDNGLFTSFLWLLLPLAFIGYLAWQRMNEPPAEPPAPTAAAEPAAAPAAAPVAAAPAAAPGLARIALSGGTDIEAAADGVETKIIAFINDASATVDKGTWFNFDRLTFETGSDRLTSDSKAQIDNIVAILKAYPAVKMKIGGYTDNTGDPQANLDLSGRRAVKVMEAIVAGGIAADRVEAEGYGDQHPVADNATEEGRALNRRTAVSIRAK